MNPQKITEDSAQGQAVYTDSEFARWSPQALAALGRLDFIAREVLDGVRQGLHRSIRRGFSSEFFDYKNYQPGDDASKIDWRLFAKTNKFFVKRFEAETSLECMVVADFSESMRWKWKNTVSKLEYEAMIAASLALLFTQQRDLVGLHSFGTLPQKHLKPRASAKQAEAFISLMNPASGDISSDKKNNETPPTLLQTASGISSILSHRGLIILISDFEMEDEAIRESLALLKAKENELLIFHILDIAEIELPFDDCTHFMDAEDGVVLPVNIKNLRELQKKRVADFRKMVKSAAEIVNAAYVPIDTSLSPVDAILRISQARKELF